MPLSVFLFREFLCDFWFGSFTQSFCEFFHGSVSPWWRNSMARVSSQFAVILGSNFISKVWFFSPFFYCCSLFVTFQAEERSRAEVQAEPLALAGRLCLTGPQPAAWRAASRAPAARLCAEAAHTGRSRPCASSFEATASCLLSFLTAASCRPAWVSRC